MENKEIVLKKALTLKARLGPLSEYIEDGGGKSFDQFLIEKGIPKEGFLADLPDRFKSLPINSFDQIIGYTSEMNKLYSSLMKAFNGVIVDPVLESRSGITDGDSLPHGRYYNGDGTIAINPAEDADNWVELPTYDDKSESDLRWGYAKAWEWVVKWDEIVKKAEADLKKMIDNPGKNMHLWARNEQNKLIGLIAYNQMKIDDAMAIIYWISKRLDGSMKASDVRVEFENLMNQRRAEQEAIKANAGTKPKQGFLDKFKDTLNDITRIAKQDWRSIVSGLKKSPKEILEDLKKEGTKSIQDVKVFVKENVNIQNANKYNPIFVLGRKGFKTLLELNIFGLAWNFNRMRTDADQSYWTKVTKKWELLGGDIGSLTQSIDKGKGKTPIVYKLKNLKINFNADGGNKAALVTGTIGTLALATPTLVNSIAEGTIGPETTLAIETAGGVVAAMAPIMIAFGKKKGENVSGDERDKPIGEGEMPPAPTEPTNEPIPTGVKIAVGAGLGLALIIGASLLIFGGKGK